MRLREGRLHVDGLLWEVQALDRDLADFQVRLDDRGHHSWVVPSMLDLYGAEGRGEGVNVKE